MFTRRMKHGKQTKCSLTERTYGSLFWRNEHLHNVHLAFQERGASSPPGLIAFLSLTKILRFSSFRSCSRLNRFKLWIDTDFHVYLFCHCLFIFFIAFCKLLLIYIAINNDHLSTLFRSLYFTFFFFSLLQCLAPPVQCWYYWSLIFPDLHGIQWMFHN